MLSSFIAAGIPIHTLRNESLRLWLTKYAKNGSSLPSEDTIRRKLGPLGAKDINTTLEICRYLCLRNTYLFFILLVCNKLELWFRKMKRSMEIKEYVKYGLWLYCFYAVKEISVL